MYAAHRWKDIGVAVAEWLRRWNGNPSSHEVLGPGFDPRLRRIYFSSNFNNYTFESAILTKTSFTIEIEIRFIDSGYSPINHQLPKSLQYQSLLN